MLNNIVVKFDRAYHENRGLSKVMCILTNILTIFKEIRTIDAVILNVLRRWL